MLSHSGMTGIFILSQKRNIPALAGILFYGLDWY